MPNRLDLNRLQIFREVVTAGSFSKAASHLRQPKSRISRQIAALEKHLGTQLIYRTTRQFRLTKVGEDLYHKAAPLLLELTSALNHVSSESDEVSGTIRVTVPEDIGVELMGGLCHEFLALYPNLHLVLLTSNHYINLVKDSVDVAIRVGKSKDSSLIQKHIGQMSLVFVISPQLQKQYQLRTVEDLAALPFLSFSCPERDDRQAEFTSGARVRRVKLNASFAANNFFTLRDMVIRGAGFALIPRLLVHQSLANGQLVELFADWKTESHPLQILIPQQKKIPLRIRKFINFMTLRLAQLIDHNEASSEEGVLFDSTF